MPKKSNNSSLSPEDIDILKRANAGVAFDSIATSDAPEIQSKINVSSQNADTGLPSYNPDDARPYERKNLPDGFHRSGTGSK